MWKKNGSKQSYVSKNIAVANVLTADEIVTNRDWC